jgi:hypothetical protein
MAALELTAAAYRGAERTANSATNTAIGTWAPAGDRAGLTGLVAIEQQVTSGRCCDTAEARADGRRSGRRDNPDMALGRLRGALWRLIKSPASSLASSG